MPWTSIPTKTGVTITHTDWNTYVAGNLNDGVPVRLADIDLAFDATEILISDIPQGFDHLQLLMSLRSTQALGLSSTWFQFNGDLQANYDRQFSVGIATGTAGNETFGDTRGQMGNIPGASATANVFGSIESWIGYYSQTSNHKIALSTWSAKYGVASSNFEVGFMGSSWRSSAAIESIRLTDSGPVGFAAGSRVTVVGWP